MIGAPDVTLLCTAKDRPAYLAKALGAWTTVRGIGRIGQLVVALGESPARDGQIEVIKVAAAAMGVDHKTTVLADSPAAAAGPGMHRALGEALTYARDQGPAAVICTEEDIAVSDDVLEYMLWALNRFAGQPRVTAVCAHDMGGQGWDIPGIGELGFRASQDTAALTDYFNPWCWATWCDTRLELLLDTWDWDADAGPTPNQNGYDWGILRQIRQRRLLAVVPEASRSQNMGRDGGYYARPELFDQTLTASFRAHREPTAYRLTGEHHG